jgi:hypothetical protein
VLARREKQCSTSGPWSIACDRPQRVFAKRPRRHAGDESPTSIAATLDGMAEVDGKPLDERLQEIGAQLAWVRDYL